MLLGPVMAVILVGGLWVLENIYPTHGCAVPVEWKTAPFFLVVWAIVYTVLMLVGVVLHAVWTAVVLGRERTEAGGRIPLDRGK